MRSLGIILLIILVFSLYSCAVRERKSTTKVINTPSGTVKVTNNKSSQEVEATLKGGKLHLQVQGEMHNKGDLKPVGFAKEVDDILRPALSKLFKGAELKSYYNMSSGAVKVATLSYELGDKLTADSIQKLLQALKDAGLEVTYQAVEGKQFSAMCNHDKKLILLEGEIGKNVIKVQVHLGE